MMKKNIFAVAASLLLGCTLFVSASTAAEEILTCGGGTEQTAQPGIAIKSENSCSAVTETAANIPQLPPERWSYRITNTGNVKMTNVRVIDDRFSSINCQNTDLEAGQSMTCVAHDLISGVDLNNGQGCVVGDHVTVKDSGVQVTTKGDCDSGT